MIFSAEALARFPPPTHHHQRQRYPFLLIALNIRETHDIMNSPLTLIALLLALFHSLVLAAPRPGLHRRTDPFFPDEPPSCPICAQDYPNINSCAQAAPVLANFTNIIFNPGAFIDVIKCACTDTFQASFPQCADCFIRTNQTDVLDTPDLPGILEGIRQICGMSSTILGNVSGANGELTPTSATPEPTVSNGGSEVRLVSLAYLAVFPLALLAVL
ncbi:hypothetical protein ONZ45_g14589 [Pleurotus djamor]|nr:hypothetical protein ONZ45_g14589 [Pleurotus djamor]